MKSIFFYHDQDFKQVWKKQEIDDFFNQTDFDLFSKEKYPLGFDSVFIFVDHCDFDSVRKVKAVFYGTSDETSKDFGKKGIIGLGLTATKSIFINSSGTENLGFEDKEYQKIIKRLSKDGIEIAPHSLSSGISFKKSDKLLLDCLKTMKQFKPGTWVDHGYLLHNLTRFGWDKKSPYFILDKLKKDGYNFFWSRIDYSLNSPSGNLNLLNSEGRAGKDYLTKCLSLASKKEKLYKVLFVFFWDFIGDLIGLQAKDDFVLSLNMIQYYWTKLLGREKRRMFIPSTGPIKRSFLRLVKPSSYYKMIKNFFHPDETNSQTAAIYPLMIGNEEIYFFNTLWINDIENSYSPENINKLISEKGTHIGHNYLSADVRHYLSKAFYKKGGDYFISEKFHKSLFYLKKCQEERKLLVTTVKDYGNFYRQWLKVSVKKINSQKILIKNNLSEKVTGITFSLAIGRNGKFLFSKQKKYHEKESAGKKIIWFDLNPKEEVGLEILKK